MTATDTRRINTTRHRVEETFPALTGLRGAAALMVLAAHVHLAAAIADSTSIPARIRAFGWVGVPMFFVLSGFLITWLALREVESTGTFRLRNFLVRRSLRIFPLYYAIAAFGLAAAYAPVHQLANLGVASVWALPLATFTTNFAIVAHHGGKRLSYLTPLWSLAAEVQFYVLWSFCLKTLTRRRLIAVALVAIAASTALRFSPADSEFIVYRVQVGGSLGSLMTGCLVALCFDASRKILRYGRFVEAALIAAFAATALAAWPSPQTQLGRCAVMTAVDAECAVLLILLIHSYGSIARLFQTRTMQFLGEISYPFYVLHSLVLLLYYTAMRHFPVQGVNPWLIFTRDFLVAGSITAAVSTLWNVIEEPIRRKRRQLSAARQ